MPLKTCLTIRQDYPTGAGRVYGLGAMTAIVKATMLMCSNGRCYLYEHPKKTALEDLRIVGQVVACMMTKAYFGTEIAGVLAVEVQWLPTPSGLLLTESKRAEHGVMPLVTAEIGKITQLECVGYKGAKSLQWAAPVLPETIRLMGWALDGAGDLV
jgi:hypothetical protein